MLLPVDYWEVLGSRPSWHHMYYLANKYEYAPLIIEHLGTLVSTCLQAYWKKREKKRKGKEEKNYP